jgi:hypothetical protein
MCCGSCISVVDFRHRITGASGAFPGREAVKKTSSPEKSGEDVFFNTTLPVLYFAKKFFTASFGTISSWKMYAPVLGDFTIFITFE